MVNTALPSLPATSPARRIRLLPLTALAFLLAMPVVRFAQDGGPVLSALGVLVGAIDVGVIPGLLVCALVGALASGSLFEAIAVGFGTSFVIVQVLTLVALFRHVSSARILVGLWAVSCILALLMMVWRPRNRSAAPIGRSQWLIGGLAVVLGLSLYMQSPFEPWMTGEDAIHLAVIQRLALEPAPALDNIYYAPHFIYTYPFPSIHYFVALVSRAVDLEPVFVYQKLRMFWAPIALFTLYGAARLIFQSERVAVASALTAVTLTLSGAFGPITSTWGQLAPVSHASDVAMTVLLPTLLLLAMNFAVAETIRTKVLFLFGTLVLALTITVVHIREVVQFLVYTAAASVAYRTVMNDRRMARRFGVMTVATLVLVVAYLKWYQAAVGHVDAVVAQRRAMLVEYATTLSPREFLTPIFLHGYFMVNQQYFFYMWIPIVLLLAPIVLLAYRSRPLVPLVGASLLAYAIIVFIPIVSIVYVYLTYYEILFTPVRNSLFFVYLLAGPLLLLAADALAGIRDRRRQLITGGVILAVLLAAYLFFAYAFAQPKPSTVQNLFFLTLVAGCTAALVGWPRVAWRTAPPGASTEDAGWARTAAAPFFALLAAVAIIGFSWKHSPLHFDPTSSKWTSRQYHDWMTDVKVKAYSTFKDPQSGVTVRLAETEALMAAPSPELTNFGRRALPANAVLVHNIFNLYASSVFMPQHILMWPMDGTAGMEFNARLFPTPWAALLRTAEAYHAQPFFNEQETLAERVNYMHEVGATHVLVDPMYYSRLRPLFAQWIEGFDVAYDDGSRWAVLALK